MKYFLSAIVVPVIISGSMLYDLTNAIPVHTYGTNSSFIKVGRDEADIATDRSSSWGLARLNGAQTLPPNPEYDKEPHQLNWPYHLDRNMLGKDTMIFIIDTGVLDTHDEFLPGRVSDGYCFPRPEEWDCFGGAYEDTGDHGTGVASVAAGLSYGVAKQATIVSYKVLIGVEGTKGVNPIDMAHAIEDAKNRFQKEGDKVKAGVINISANIVSDLHDRHWLHDRTNEAIAAGMHVVISGGHEYKDSEDSYSRDSCHGKKKVEGDWIVVGGTEIDDKLFGGSNYGECIDIYAPADKMFMASSKHDKATNIYSGNSYAVPLVAGVIAAIGGSNEELARNPKAMKKYILDNAVKDKIKGFPKDSKSNNLILQSPVQRKIVIDDSATSDTITPGEFYIKEEKQEHNDKYLKWLTKS